MATLSASQIASMIKWFSEESETVSQPISDSNAVIAIAVALAESGGKTDAKGGPNSNGTYDWGLWQINDIHNPSPREKTEPGPNWVRAYAISSQGTNWTPWTTYKNGDYTRHLISATAAWGSARPLAPSELPTAYTGDAPLPTVTFTQVDFPSPFDFLNDPLNYMLDPRNKVWLRLGMGIAGLMLIFIVVASLMKQPLAAAAKLTPIGKAIKVAK